MICPRCGLGGSADTGRYGKKVRCPKCLAVFKVSDEVIFEPPSSGAIEQSIIQSDQAEPLDVDNPDTLNDGLFDTSLELGDSSLGECSRCGFSFSRDFLKMIDNQPVCPVCEG